jgi:hypothetical protein
MATTITFDSASPHSLIIHAAGDGAAATKTNVEVLAACAAGPLKAKLAKVADWTAFNLGGALCGLVHARSILNRTGPTSGEPTALEFFWTATGIKMACTGECQVEIRFQQSERR